MAGMSLGHVRHHKPFHAFKLSYVVQYVLRHAACTAHRVQTKRDTSTEQGKDEKWALGPPFQLRVEQGCTGRQHNYSE